MVLEFYLDHGYWIRIIRQFIECLIGYMEPQCHSFLDAFCDQCNQSNIQ